MDLRKEFLNNEKPSHQKEGDEFCGTSSFSDLKSAIKGQIDWEYIQKLKQDSSVYAAFMRKGRRMMKLTKVLQEVESSP